MKALSGERVRSRRAVLSAPPRARGIQIGPKIRIGGSVGKVGQNIKNAVVKGVKDTGHAVGKVADNPWVQGGLAAALAATGGGAPAAAAILAATRGGGKLLKPGGNIGQGLRGAAEGAALGAGASKAGSLIKGGGAGLGGLIRGGGSDGQGNFGALGDVAGKLGGTLGRGAAGLVGGGGGGGFGLSDLLDAGLGTAGLINAGQLADKSNQYAKSAYDDVRESYDARKGLREAGIAGLLNPGAGVPLKMAGVNANTGVGNPFSSKRKSPGVPL